MLLYRQEEQEEQLSRDRELVGSRGELLRVRVPLDSLLSFFLEKALLGSGECLLLSPKPLAMTLK